VRLLPTFLLLGFTSVTAAAEVTDPATLFPADTLAYVELGKPAATAEAFGKFAEGSVFAESLEFLQGRRDTLTANNPTTGIVKAGEISLLASPELLAEFKRLRGIGCALTGFDAKTGRPNVALAVLLGESHAAGLLARHFLASSPMLRRVGKVDGQAIYQYRGLNSRIPGEPMDVEKPEDLMPAAGPNEPTYLYAPGLFVVGSNAPAVADVYRRFTGKETSTNFTAHKEFKAFETVRNQAGLAFFADPASFDKRYTTAKKLTKQPLFGSEQYAYLRFLLNLPSANAIVGQWRPEADGYVLNLQIRGESPLAKLLAGNGAGVGNVSPMPQFNLSLRGTEDKSKAVLNLMDALAKARGEIGALPSERLNEVEIKEIGTLLNGLNSASLIWPDKQSPPKGQPLWPLLVLNGTSAQTTSALDAAMPKLVKFFAALDTEPVPALDTDPKRGSIRGLAFTLGDQSLRFHYQLQSGNRLVLGLDPDAVAVKLDEAVAKPLDVALSGLLPLGSLRKLVPEKPIAPKTAENPFVKQNPSVKAGPGIHDALDKLPPLMLEAGTRANVLEVTIKQSELKKPFAEFAKAFLIWIESQGPRNDPNYQQYEMIEKFQLDR
jgi:hypothetical protein